MTCIEFLDKAVFENIYACLFSFPDRVIFVDSNEETLKRETEKYRSFFSKRGENIEFIPCLIPQGDLDGAVEVISDIINRYDDCVFDIFGGNELLFIALGIAYERNKDKKVRINRHNFKNGIDSVRREAQLTVEEYIWINGGNVVDEGPAVDPAYCLNMTDDLKADIDKMYYLCKNRSKLWNSMTSLLSLFDKIGEKSNGGLTVFVSKKVYETLSSEKKADLIKVSKLLLYLERRGILAGLKIDNSADVEITYKNRQVKKCLMKAGQILEMKVYKIAKELTENGKAICNDVKNGVVIDWSETYSDSTAMQSTKNEIDVFAMAGLIPVFISCKNGAVDTEELYKLNTVASKFGGEKARKILVATSLPQSSEKMKYFRQRMKDMDIHLIEGLKDLNDKDFRQMLKSIILSKH